MKNKLPSLGPLHFIGIAILFMMILGFFQNSAIGTKEYDSINAYKKDVVEGIVSTAVLKPNLATVDINGELKDGMKYKIKALPESSDELESFLLDYNVGVSVEAPKVSFWGVLLNFLPYILIAVLLLFFLRSQQNAAQGIRKNFGRANTVMRNEPNVRFTDVAGMDEVIEEVKEIRDYLINPEKYRAAGAKCPKGVLLVGPPGCGKTLLARALSGEAKVPFYSISGSDFVEMFVGVGAARVRDLFAQALATPGSKGLIFIDEIDAVGRHRGAGIGGGHDEREQTLNQLLVEMDGFDQHAGVVVVAATNRADILDPALLRPGRFDRQIMIPLPDMKGREAILKAHAHGKSLSGDVNLRVIARRTPGFNGAHLANLLNEAAFLAVRAGRRIVEMVDIDEAVDRILAGPKRPILITEKEKRLIAYHEAGHALIGYALRDAETVQRVSVVPRGYTGGITWLVSEEEHLMKTKNELRAEITVFMGGRAAENLVTGDNPSTGASNDISQATKIARMYVTQYGFTEEMGPVQYGDLTGPVFLGGGYQSIQDYGHSAQKRIDAEVQKLCEASLSLASSIIAAHRDALEAIVNALIEKESETLIKEEIEEIFIRHNVQVR